MIPPTVFPVSGHYWQICGFSSVSTLKRGKTSHTVRKLSFCVMKGILSQAKSCPFTTQKDSFRNTLSTSTLRSRTDTAIKHGSHRGMKRKVFLSGNAGNRQSGITGRESESAARHPPVSSIWPRHQAYCSRNPLPSHSLSRISPAV